MALLAIDPGRSYKGEASIGVCVFFNYSYNEYYRESITFESLVKYLGIKSLNEGSALFYGVDLVTEVVIEDFVNNDRSKGGQRNGTSECIGAVEFACIKTNTPFIRQPPSALGPAKIHAGYDQKVKHLPHQDSAYLHGFEYLVRKGLVAPVNLAATMKEH